LLPYNLLQAGYPNLSEDHVVSFSLEINVEEALTNIRQLQTILFRTLGLLQRLGLPEQVSATMDVLRRLITLFNQVRLAIIALEAASGPYGWALATLGAATIPISAGNVFYEVRNG